MTVPLTVALTATFVAALTDWWKYRVHNLLTLPFMASGLIYHYWLDGWVGLGSSMAGLLFGFSILFIFFLMGGMGAGDVKLMAGIGSWLGLPLTFQVFIVASLICGIYALILIFAYSQYQKTWGKLRILWFRLVALGRHLSSEDQLEAEINKPEKRQHIIPFAVMMAIGLGLLVGWTLFNRPLP